MSIRVYLSVWSFAGDKVKLTYEDGTVFYVDKKDFNDSFGFVVNADKDVVKRTFRLEEALRP